MESEKNKKFNNMKIFLGPSKNTFKRSNDNRSLNSSTSPTKITNKKTKSREDSSEEEEMEECTKTPPARTFVHPTHSNLF